MNNNNSNNMYNDEKNNESGEQNIEDYILSQFPEQTEENKHVQEKIIQSWKDNKKQLMDSKYHLLYELEQEKNRLNDDKDNHHIRSKEKEFTDHQRKYDHMKTYLDYCLEQVQNQINDHDTKKNSNEKWHPNDIELVQAVVAANRYTFQNVHDDDENQFQQDVKKRKKENNIIIEETNQKLMLNNINSNSQKIIHTKRWNANVDVIPIVSFDTNKKTTNDVIYSSFQPIPKNVLYCKI